MPEEEIRSAGLDDWEPFIAEGVYAAAVLPDVCHDGKMGIPYNHPALPRGYDRTGNNLHLVLLLVR
jgi:hypothetical protein